MSSFVYWLIVTHSIKRLPSGSAILLLGALFLGCGGSKTTTVKGIITFQGKAVAGGLINFQSADGKVLGGPFNEDGSYEFSLPPGEYKVRIDAPGQTTPWKEGDPEPKPVPRLAPAKYAGYGTSGLTATVGHDSSQQLDFPLK